MNQRPLFPDAGVIPITVVIIRKSVVVLTSVDNLNKVPKGLPFSVQADFALGKNLEDNNGLLTAGGKLYCWDTGIHRYFTR